MGIKIGNNVRKAMFMLFAVIMVITSLIDLILPKTAEAVGGIGFTNPDASKPFDPDTYDYLRKSDFVNGANNSARYIRPGSRSAWYTCWGYGSSNYGKFSKYHKDIDSIFTSNNGLCSGDQKRLEYELYAESDTRNSAIRMPVIGNAYGERRLKVSGWATLGGYGHHDASNQSSYLALVKQVNNADSTNVNDVFLIRNKNLNIDVTEAMNYMFTTQKMAGDEFNVLRGITSAGYPRVEGNNLRYEDTGFTSYIPLDSMFDKGMKEGKYKLYLVKRVNDMIVKSEVSFPQSKYETKYGYGKITLSGNDESNSLRANGTAVMIDGVLNGGFVPGMNRGVLNLNEKVLFKDIVKSSYGVSRYWFSRPSAGNQLGENYSQYFVYGNKSSYLTYTMEDLNIKVNHLDYKTNANVYVRDASGFKIGTKGSGAYPEGKQIKLLPYKVGEDGVTQLTNSSGTAKYILRNPSYIETTISKNNLVYNFYYIDMNRDALVKVNYLDIETGKEIKTGYTNSNFTVGSTQKIPVSQKDILFEDRNYKYVRTDSNGKDINNYLVQKGVNQINVYFEKQPRVTVEYYDKDTGITFKTYTDDVPKNSDYKPNAPAVITVNGKPYTRWNKDIPNQNITKDTVIRIPYTTKTIKPRPTGGPMKEVEEESLPKFNLGEMSWRIYKEDKDGLEAKFKMNASIIKPHSTPDGKGTYKVEDYLINNKVNMYVGKGSVKDSGNTPGNSNYFFKEVSPNNGFNYDIKELMDKGLATKHDDSKITKYQIETKIKHYNVMKRTFACIEGPEDRCFEWDVSEYKLYTQEDDDSPVNQNKVVTINGKQVPVVKTLDKVFSLDVDTKTGKVVDITETNYNSVKSDKYTVGRSGIYKDVSKASDSAVNNLDNVVRKVEEVYPEINAFKTILPTQQSSMLIDEKVNYKNDFSEKLSEPRKDSIYYIDELDKNLEESLGTTGEDKNKLNLEFGKADNTFKLSKVFDVSNKYGVQVMTDKKGITDDKRKANLESELVKLGLGQDELVENKLYAKDLSAFYLPIDDIKYKPGEPNKFIDDIKLKDLGLNDVNFDYSKQYWFKQYLYGNVEDNPVYTQEKRPLEEVEYTNNLTLTQDMIKDLRGKITERKDMYNLFRITDDGEVSKNISK